MKTILLLITLMASLAFSQESAETIELRKQIKKENRGAVALLITGITVTCSGALFTMAASDPLFDWEPAAGVGIACGGITSLIIGSKKKMRANEMERELEVSIAPVVAPRNRSGGLQLSLSF